MEIYKHNIYILVYLFFAFVFLIFVGIDAVEGKIDFEFYADSETYIEFVQSNDGILNFLEINPNLLGPILILKLFNNNYILVFILHCFIVFYFTSTIVNHYEIDLKPLFLLLLISPMFFSSIILVNKEIMALFVISIFLNYLKSRSPLLLIFAVLISFLVRWQMALFVISSAILLSKINFIRNYIKITLIIFLIGISVVYNLFQGIFEEYNKIAEIGQETSTEGSGLFSLLIGLQNSGPLGYVIAFIPKTLFLLIGLIARYYKFFDFSELYNNVFVFLQSVANLLVIGLLLKKKVSFNNLFLFLGIVYCIIFSLSPIYSPRYFFPVYILFSLAFASRNSSQNFSIVI